MYHINLDKLIVMLLKTLLADLYFLPFIFGAEFIASSSLFSQYNSSVQSLLGLLIASVTQSEYKTNISHASNFISCSFTNFDISLIIQIATHHDFILKVFHRDCLYIIKYS